MSQLFTSDGQNIGVSASTSDLTMNNQDQFPLEWTPWIFFSILSNLNNQSCVIINNSYIKTSQFK